MTNTAIKYPRQRIAEQVSDINQIRFAIAEMQGSAYSALRQIKGGDLPEELRGLVLEAIEAIDKADKLAADRAHSLLSSPT